MRKLIAPLVGAFLLSGCAIGTPALADTGPHDKDAVCTQGTPAEFLETIADDMASGMFPVATVLNEVETQVVLDVVNPDNALTDEKFETSLWVLRRDGIAFLIPMVSGQICGMFTLQPATVEKVLKALKGRSA